jgi:hypothetical protein
MEDDGEFLKASRKCRINRENWYADELLELVAHIQEDAKNKDISKAEYVGMLDGVIKRANLIKVKMFEDKELVVFNPKDFTDNCFYKEPNTDKPSVKTVSNVIRKYLGTMNKQDIHTLCEKFGKDRVLQELDGKFIELFDIGYFDVKGGMRIPLTGDYKDYGMYKELLEMINEYKTINKKVIVNYLSEHYQEFKEKYNVEKIGLFGSYARDEATDESDIDIFIIMPPKMFDEIAIKHKIEEDLGKEVDTIRKHKNISLLLLKSIERDVIYADENFVKSSKKDEIIYKLKVLKAIYLQEGIEIIGLFGGYEDNETTIWIVYQMNDDFIKRCDDNAFKQVIRLQEIKEELKSIFNNNITFMPTKNLKNKDDLILI